MSPFRLLDLYNIDRVFSLAIHDDWLSLFTLSLCSTKTKNAIKRWAHFRSLAKTLNVELAVKRAPTLSIFNGSRTIEMDFVTSRDCHSDRHRWQSANRFSLKGDLGTNTFAADRVDEEVVAVVEHIMDLFHISIDTLYLTLPQIKDLGVYLQCIRQSKRLYISKGSLPELPWVLDNFCASYLILTHVNPGPDFHHVIRTENLTIHENNDSYIPGAVLMLTDCKKIRLDIRNITNVDVNLFIKKWMEEPYNQKFEELQVEDDTHNEGGIGDPDIILDGIDSRDVTPPARLRLSRYIYQKEIVRGDGKRAILSLRSFGQPPEEMRTVYFKVLDDVAQK